MLELCYAVLYHFMYSESLMSTITEHKRAHTTSIGSLAPLKLSISCNLCDHVFESGSILSSTHNHSHVSFVVSESFSTSQKSLQKVFLR